MPGFLRASIQKPGDHLYVYNIVTLKKWAKIDARVFEGKHTKSPGITYMYIM